MTIEGINPKHCLIYFALLSSLTVPSKSENTIRSPEITNWGVWGALELCPPELYAAGMELKVEAYQGKDDDTALNGIRLLCIPLGTNNFSKAVWIKSEESAWGVWGSKYLCDRGVVTGFQLRTEGNLGSSGDNTAANKIRIFCSNLKGGYLEGDGQPWGDWTHPQMCLSEQVVCGLKTQIHPYQGDGDDTGLNNIQMKCCDVPSIAKTCTPADEWETLLECDNIKGTEPLKCTFRKTRGIVKSNTASEGLLHESNVAADIGFSAAGFYQSLSANFKANYHYSESTEYSWDSASSETWNEATTITAEFDVPGGMKAVLSQAVGNCGIFNIYSNYYRKEDFNGGEDGEAAITLFHSS